MGCAPPPPHACVEKTPSGICITLTPLPLRETLRSAGFMLLFCLLALGWTTVVIVLFPEMWKSAAVVAVLFLGLGIVFSLLAAWGLWSVVRSVLLSTTVLQDSAGVTVRRVASRDRFWATADISALDADTVALYVCERDKWRYVSFPGRAANELRWLAHTLAERMQVPESEPFAENEFPICFAVVDGFESDESVSKSQPSRRDVESLKSGRLTVGPGWIILRSDEHRAVRYRFVSEGSASLIERLLPRWVLPVARAVLTPDRLTLFADNDRTWIQIACGAPGKPRAMAIELTAEDEQLLRSAVDTLWSA